MGGFNVVKEYRINTQTNMLDMYVQHRGKLIKATWAALPGSQAAFLACPELLALYQGTRGGCGKTLALLMDFAQFCGIGLGAEHSGIIIKRSYPETKEIEKLGNIWLPKLFPGISWNGQNHEWHFPTGEVLRVGFFMDPNEQEFDRYRGSSFSWCALDEAASFPELLQIMGLMMSCLRLGNPMLSARGLPHFRLTTNTFGPARDQILDYFKLDTHWHHPTCVGPLVAGDADENGNKRPDRRTILGRIQENIPMMYADPTYLDRLTADVEKSQGIAWRTAVWTAAPSSMFGDIDFGCVRLPNFTVPAHLISKIRLGYDFGDSMPFAFLFYLMWDGSEIVLDDGAVISDIKKGSIIILDEIYGGSKNKGLRLSISEQAARIHAKVLRNGWDPQITRKYGNVADNSIFGSTPGYSMRASIADDFERAGVRFIPADKSPGSRIQGVQQIRKLLLAAKPGKLGIREAPALFFCERCTELMNHIPNLQRDPKNTEDVESDKQPDHDYDALRYLCLERPSATSRPTFSRLGP